MEHLNKIRLAAENQMRERARKQAEARVAELERGGRLNELPTPSKNGNNRRTSPNEATNGESAPKTPATAPASAMKTPSVGGTGGVETSPYATPAPDFASSAGSTEDVAVAVASLQSELEAMRRRQAAFNDELESRIDARSPAAVPHAAIDEAVTRRIQESVASIIAPYVEATIGRVREEMRAQILAETNANISASNEAAEETVERIGGLLGAAEAAARGAKEAAAAAEEAAVASEQRTERAEAHAAEAASCVADALDAKRSESVSPEMNARIAALEAALGDAERRAAAAEGEAREATATAKAAVRAAEQTARDVNATAKAAETQLATATQLARDEARGMERRATEMEARAAEAERRAKEAEASAKEAEASAKEAREAAAAPAPPPPPPPPVDSVAAAPTPVPVPAPTSDPDTGAVAASVRADLAGEIASLKRAADEAVEVARQARAAQTELRAKCMDEVRSIRAAVKSLAPVVGAPSATAPPSPIKDRPNETEEAKEAITAALRTELDALKRRVENLAGIASTSKSAEAAANEASKMAKSSMRAVENIEGEMKKLAVKADDAIASAASALAAAAAAAEDAPAAAESADTADQPKTDGSSIALSVDDVAARVDALQHELKETAVIVQTNAEGIAFLGQQTMHTAKKDDVEELRASVNKTAERARKETDALKAATQASLEELEGRTKKLERGARRQSENREATPSAPARDGVETVSPQAVSALEKRMAALEASTAATPLSSEAKDVAAGGDVKERVEKFESVASELTARVERLQEAVGVEMLAHMKRLDAKLKTVEQSLGEAKQQGTPTNAKQESGKPGKLDRANAARLASAEKAAAESRSTAEDAAEKAKLASEKAKAALAAVAEHAATTERVKEAETKLRELSGEIEKFRADVAEMEVSSATNTADVVAIEGEWASARRHLKDLEQSVWKSMVMIREEAGLGTPSSDAGAATPATPTTAPAATGGTPLAATGGRTPETPMSSFRALFSRGRRTSTAPRSTESESARRLRARRTESPERRDVARSEAVIEALDMGSPTRPARRSANRER